MEESYETFEEELGPPRANPPPQKPVRQICRPEMYATRKIREEMAPQQARVEPKSLAREPNLDATSSLNKTLTLQKLKQMETPWESVTLNRCLFVAITILVLTSGFHRLHETLRGQGTAEEEEEVGVEVRRSRTLRHRQKIPEPDTSLWEVMFWWLPDLDDEDEEEEEDDNDEKQLKSRRSIKNEMPQGSRGLRNKPMLHKNLMKQKERKLKNKRSKMAKDEETKNKRQKAKNKELNEVADDEKASEEDDQSDQVVKKAKQMLKTKKEPQKA